MRYRILKSTRHLTGMKNTFPDALNYLRGSKDEKEKSSTGFRTIFRNDHALSQSNCINSVSNGFCRDISAGMERIC